MVVHSDAIANNLGGMLLCGVRMFCVQAQKSVRDERDANFGQAN